VCHKTACFSQFVLFSSLIAVILTTAIVKLNEMCVTEPVFDKLWKAGVFSDSEDKLPVYLDVHDAVLATVELDDTLHQQVCTTA